MRRNKAFIVSHSNGKDIKIDQEEYPKVMKAVDTGRPVMVKQGMINPSFVVNITLDNQRIRNWLDETHYGFGQGEEAKKLGIPALDNLTGVEELDLLESGKAELPKPVVDGMKELTDKMRLK